MLAEAGYKPLSCQLVAKFVNRDFVHRDKRTGKCVFGRVSGVGGVGSFFQFPK